MHITIFVFGKRNASFFIAHNKVKKMEVNNMLYEEEDISLVTNLILKQL